jgi:hypothetical protein
MRKLKDQREVSYEAYQALQRIYVYGHDRSEGYLTVHFSVQRPFFKTDAVARPYSKVKGVRLAPFFTFTTVG